MRSSDPSGARAPCVAGLVLVAATLSACADGLTDPPERLDVGIVQYFEQPVEIEFPDVVEGGVPFTLKVRTYGDGCRRGGPTEVSIRDPDVHVTPYDYTWEGPNVLCAQVVRTFEHEVEITLHYLPGSRRIYVYGRARPGVGVEVHVGTVEVRPGGSG